MAVLQYFDVGVHVLASASLNQPLDLAQSHLRDRRANDERDHAPEGEATVLPLGCEPGDV